MHHPAMTGQRQFHSATKYIALKRGHDRFGHRVNLRHHWLKRLVGYPPEVT